MLLLVALSVTFKFIPETRRAHYIIA